MTRGAGLRTGPRVGWLGWGGGALLLGAAGLPVSGPEMRRGRPGFGARLTVRAWPELGPAALFRGGRAEVVEVRIIV